MSTKEQIITVLDFMTENQLKTILEELQQSYVIKSKSWEDIPEVEPDEIDLQMIKEIENDPDCHIFKTEEEWAEVR